MKIKSLLVLLLIVLSSKLIAQFNVTGIYTDYNNFWQSSTTAINPLKPERNHHMLAFTWNGTTFSTGVNDARLTSQGISFLPRDFRAFPIDAVNASSGSGNTTYIGLGQLQDGVHDGGSTPAPFPTPANSARLASYLTDGIKGLDIGTGIANIAAGHLRFNLSSLGISASAIDDNVPDVVVTQIASPSSSTLDSIYFVNSSGGVVGNKLPIDHTSVPVLGKWMPDFYVPSGSISIKNSERDIRLWAADLTSFGITAGNVGNAVALVYKLSGQSDVAFVAFNVPSISVATQLTTAVQPSTPVNPGCCGNTGTSALPQQPVIQVRDASGNNILQAGILVTASVLTGPVGHGSLGGNTTVTTNASGVATFSNLIMPCEVGDYVMQFTSSNLEPASSNIVTVTKLQYYVKPAGVANLSALTSWSLTADGTGASPDNFSSGKEFILDNTAGTNSFATGANWSLSGKLIIPAGKTLTVSDNSTTTLSCDISQVGTIESGTGSTLVLNGTALQTLAGPTSVKNLTVNNAAGARLSAPTVVSNTMRLTNGTLTVSATTLTLNGPITRTSGNISASAASSGITFSGSSAQTIPSSTFAGSVRSVIVNNAAGVTINSPTTISDNLSLVNGRLIIGSHPLTVGTMSGGSESAYVQTNGTGKLITNVAGTGGQKTFPVGNSNYNPVSITNNNTAADQFEVRVLDEMYANSVSGSVLSAPRIAPSWNIQKTGINTGSGFGMLFTWATSQNAGVITPSLYAYESKWVKETAGISNSPTSTSFSYTGYTGSATYFGMLAHAAILPLVWKNFSATQEGAYNRLNWSTASEQNTHEFIVERSMERSSWQAIGRVNAAGTSISTRDYSLNDYTPLEGHNYYRIKQVDIDAKFTYSEVRLVKLNKTNRLVLINNPVRNKQLVFKTSIPEKVSLYDTNGKLIWSQNFQEGMHTISVSHLPAGTYVLRAGSITEQVILK